MPEETAITTPQEVEFQTPVWGDGAPRGGKAVLNRIIKEKAAGGTPNNREVAKAIRPLLEGFLRAACPEHFRPGTLLGPFLNLCAQRVGTPQQILDAQATQELHDLVEYANRFHHDTNAAWETEAINDGELAGFVRRALSFVKP